MDCVDFGNQIDSTPNSEDQCDKNTLAAICTFVEKHSLKATIDEFYEKKTLNNKELKNVMMKRTVMVTHVWPLPSII